MDSGATKSEQVEETAARWFARRQSGTWSESDQAQFTAWLEASTAHRIQYIRVTTAWEHCARMQALGAGVRPGVIPPRGSWGDARFPGGPAPAALDCDNNGGSLAESIRNTAVSPTPPRRMRRSTLAAGAAAALTALVIGAYLLNTGWLAGGRYSTPIGGLEDVTLADGSRITLNTATRLRVSLRGTERRIDLERGEAFFEVAKDPSRPFAVYAGDKRVVAVGTKFAVRRERDDVRVVVTEGRVSLAAADDGVRHLLAQSRNLITQQLTQAGAPPTFLRAGAVARTSDAEVLVHPGAVAAAEKLLSWRTGRVSFENWSLAEAIAEFNRYNTQQIVIHDPVIAAARFGGNFRATNTDAFLDLVQLDLGQRGLQIAIERDGDRIVLKAP